ncbi:MAG TPA: hypothetical protein VHG91_06100 [Longimicrobium sp.]|nr:hypothetical protein [Longimicrobium sp.]
MKGRTPLLALAAVFAALAAGCAPSKGEATPAPDGPAKREWTAASTADEIAAWAAEGCRQAEWEARQTCLEGALVSTIEPAGVDRTMGALLKLAAADEDIRREGHVLAHGIGIAAYESPETVSRTFALCTADFQSGCYHGVIQGYFADGRGAGAGVTAEKLNALCADYRDDPSKRWVSFQCGHGMGHGVMAVYRHHLFKALDACDLLADHRDRTACYGGAFMENVVNATNPHHTSTTQSHGGGEGHGAHGGSSDHAPAGGGHGHHGGASGDHGATAEEPFKALDPADPLYPCTAVKEHHRFACYQMQTSAILYNNDGDFAEASRLCGTAPEDMVRVCFTSLGRDANAWGRGERDRVIAYCDAAPEAQRPWCVVGAVKNVVDVTADPADGFDFCRAVPRGGSKNACYRAVGEHITLLHAERPARERVCAGAEYAYADECRRGANLLPRDG